MICCVILGAIVATAVRCWRIVSVQSVHTDIPFAPVARRPAPGFVVTQITSTVSSATNHPPRYLVGDMVRNMMLLGGFYLLLVWLMVQVQILVPLAPDGQWTLRTVLLGGLLLAPALLNRRILARPLQHQGRLAFIAACSMFGGLLVLALGVVDLHLFQLFSLSSVGNHHRTHYLPGIETLVFHGAALLTAVLGFVSFRAASRSTTHQGTHA